MTAPILLTNRDLLLAGFLVLLGAGTAVALRLDIARTWVIAALRMVVQLMIVGGVLTYVFAHDAIALTLLGLATMSTAAVVEAGSRQKARLGRSWHYGIAAVATMSGTAAVALIGVLSVLQPHPWYQARTVIPLTGLLLGNVMNATSLAMNAILGALDRDGHAVEARIALGATRAQAMNAPARQAVHSALIPTLNQMAAAGIVTLPGIMTGQVLAGMNPLDAARYQIVLMSLIATGGLIGAVTATLLCVARLTDRRGRLRLERLNRLYAT